MRHPIISQYHLLSANDRACYHSEGRDPSQALQSHILELLVVPGPAVRPVLVREPVVLLLLLEDLLRLLGVPVPVPVLG